MSPRTMLLVALDRPLAWIWRQPWMMSDSPVNCTSNNGVNHDAQSGAKWMSSITVGIRTIRFWWLRLFVWFPKINHQKRTSPKRSVAAFCFSVAWVLVGLVWFGWLDSIRQTKREAESLMLNCQCLPLLINPSRLGSVRSGLFLAPEAAGGLALWAS